VPAPATIKAREHTSQVAFPQILLIIILHTMNACTGFLMAEKHTSPVAIVTYLKAFVPHEE